MKPRGLSHVEVVKFYDALGARQDKTGYYEDVTLADLVTHARFHEAKSVVEFGCGTGRFAEQLLANLLPHDARYWGCDVSTTMLELNRGRLTRFGERVTLRQASDEIALPIMDGYADRFVSNYVLDILSAQEIAALLTEAKRLLKRDGLLCLTGLTHGKGLFSKLWTAFWNLRFDLNPKWVDAGRWHCSIS